MFLHVSSLSLNGFCSAYATHLRGTWYVLASSLTCHESVPLKHAEPVKTYPYSSWIVFWDWHLPWYLLSFWPCNKIVYVILALVIDHYVIIWICVSMELIFYHFFIHFSLMCLLSSIVLYFTLGMPSISTSGIPNNSGLLMWYYK